MTTKDPFDLFNDDRTVVRPFRGDNPIQSEKNTDRNSSRSFEKGRALPLLGRLNPIETCASKLLTLLANLNSAKNHPSPDALKSKLITELKEFQINCSKNSIPEATASTASYVLCTALDEAILHSSWGQESNWSKQSLLSTFHQDVTGGERFYQILKTSSTDVAQNSDILELMYICLSLGFKGRYRMVDGGEDKLIRVRNWLFDTLSSHKAAPETTLSDHWQGEIQTEKLIRTNVPVWTKIATAAAVVGLAYVALLFSLNQKSDSVLETVSDIFITPVTIESPQESAPQKPKALSLKNLLSAEIASRQISLLENSRFSKITIDGDGLFKPGKSSVNENTRSIIVSISQSLDLVSGNIEITGHSDSVPIRTAKYPSNWELSRARAESVASIIKSNLRLPERVKSEGLASMQPIAANTTREGRAKNRRVEILLLP